MCEGRVNQASQTFETSPLSSTDHPLGDITVEVIRVTQIWALSIQCRTTHRRLGELEVSFWVRAWVGLSNFVSRLVQVAAWDLGDSRSDGLSLNMSNLDPATIFPILTYPYQIRIELINEEEFPSSSDYLKYSPESTSFWLLTPTVILPNFNWTESATNGSSNFNMATLSLELYASMCIITLRYIILHVYVFDESDARSAHDSVVQSYSAHAMDGHDAHRELAYLRHHGPHYQPSACSRCLKLRELLITLPSVTLKELYANFKYLQIPSWSVVYIIFPDLRIASKAQFEPRCHIQSTPLT